MHVVLFCTSVIVQLHSVLSSLEITDITDRCLHHEVISIYLTAGIGVYDNAIVMMATEEHLNCTVEFIVMNEDYVMVVIDLLDWHLDKKVCIQDQDSTITVSNFNKTKACISLAAMSRYSTLHKAKLYINFEDLINIYTMKLIATSMRDPKLYACSIEHEVECVVREKIYCMNKVFTCDGNDNCGVANSYDEDLRKCKGMGLTPFMILCTIIMYVMSILLLVLLCLTLAPKRKETFVYKFDQSVPLFDSENGIVTYDIDIQVLFPETKTNPLQTKKSVILQK